MGFSSYMESFSDGPWRAFHIDWKSLCAHIDRIARHTEKKLTADPVAGGGTGFLFEPQRDPISLTIREDIAVPKIRNLTKDLEVLEMNFIELLDSELDKVEQFATLQATGFLRRTDELDILYARLNDPSLDSLDIDCNNVIKLGRNAISELMDGIVRLERFVNLNFAAFNHITKKHDKISQISIRDYFCVYLRKKKFYTIKLDDLIIKMSSMLTVLSQREQGVGTEMKVESKTSEDFVRKTVKYWVPLHHITELKARISENLPLYRVNKNHRESEQITSVYFDNESMDLYHGRMERYHGAIAIRIRWYGDKDPPDIVYIERKTHYEEWTGDLSVKSRFLLKAKKVTSFLSGQLKVDDELSKLRARGDYEGEMELLKMKSLWMEVQEAVLSLKLVPTVRTRYTRAAWQRGGSDRTVRISLDTNLSMMTERNVPRGSWKRDPYFGRPIPQDELCNFPFAILEVKLVLAPGQAQPEWIKDVLSRPSLPDFAGGYPMLEGPWAFPVFKFSKFIHGCSTLAGISDRVKKVPYWLQYFKTPEETILLRASVQVPDDEALNPREKLLGLSVWEKGAGVDPGSLVTAGPSRRKQSFLRTQTGPGNNTSLNRSQTCLQRSNSGVGKSPLPSRKSKNQLLADNLLLASASSVEKKSPGKFLHEKTDKDNENEREKETPIDSKKRVRSRSRSHSQSHKRVPNNNSMVTGVAVASDIVPPRSQEVALTKEELLKKKKTFAPMMSADDRDNPFKWIIEKIQRTGAVAVDEDGDISTLSKTIKLPVRIEPKVYLANERTFLSWLQLSVLLAMLSIYVIVHGVNSGKGKILGYIFVPIATLFCLYSLLVYNWRADRIRTKYAGHYDDIYGPTVLVLILVAGLISAFAVIASDM